MGKLTDGILFVRLCKTRGTVCPHVKIHEVLFVRMCKNDGVLFRRGTICPAPLFGLWPYYTGPGAVLTGNRSNKLFTVHISSKHLV